MNLLNVSAPSEDLAKSFALTTNTKRRMLAVIALVAFIFASIAATLRVLQFNNGSENLVIATALETRRTGAWLVPTLQAEIRAAKPPLATWITALAIQPQTVRQMSSPDESIRNAGANRLVWEARWPSLLCACLSLLMIYALARTVIDHETAGVAVFVTGSTLMFLRFGRLTTTDVQLLLWVSVTNMLLAYAAFVRRNGIVAMATGVAVGLAFMSKGPVALVQTVLPAATWWICVGKNDGPKSATQRRTAMMLAAGLASFVIVALPWYAWVAHHSSAVWSRWFAEVTREGASSVARSPVLAYSVLVPFMLPWTGFFIVGLWQICRDAFGINASKYATRLLLLVAWVVIPIAVMTCFRDRKDRYLLPMLGPSAVVTAIAVIQHLKNDGTAPRWSKWLIASHWLTLAAICVGLPIAGATLLHTVEHQTWYSVQLASVAAIGFAVLIAVGILLQRRTPLSLPITTLLAMMGCNVLFLLGYRNEGEGRSEMRPLADAIWRSASDTPVFTTNQHYLAVPSDLSIYANRAVKWIERPDVAGLPRPAVVIVRQEPRESTPHLSDDAIAIGSATHNQNIWHAILLPAAAGPTTVESKE